MKFDIEKVFNGLKKLSPALIAIFLSTGFIVFAPIGILTKLRLNSLSETLMQIISGLFLLSATLIISITAYAIIGKIRYRLALSKLEETIANLTEAELIRVLIMYHTPGNALSMSIQDGTTGALYGKGIITIGSTISDDVGYMTFQFILQPWVVSYLRKHEKDFIHYNNSLQEEYNKYMQMLSTRY